MERRGDPRIPVNMNATVINEGTLPIGCRVGNVSTTGIMLKHDGDNPKIPLNLDDDVEVRLSVKQDDDRRVMQLPLKIVREAESGLGGRFDEPQPELLELVEPYRINENADNARQQTDAQPAADAAMNTTTTQSRFGLALPATWVLITCLFGAVIYIYWQQSQLQAAIAALEPQNTIDTSNEIADISASLQNTNENLTFLSHEMQQLDNRNRQLETRLERLEQRLLPGPIIRSPVSSNSDTKSGSDPQSIKKADGLSTDEPKWIVNLLSLGSEQAAANFVNSAKAQGIIAEIKQESSEANQPVWRVQVSGFESKEAAATFSQEARTKLNLSSAWVYRQSD